VTPLDTQSDVIAAPAFDDALRTRGPTAPGAAGRTRAASPTKSSVFNHRSTAPVDLLSRRLDAVCTHAVSPLEIAAALEADGITDAISRDKYGHDDVFALASALYVRVPLRTSRRTAGRKSLQTTSRSIARGLLFALPGLFFFVVVPMFSSSSAPAVMLLAVMAGWGLSQIMAILGHTLVGRGNGSSAGKVLGLMLIAGLALMCVGGAVAAFGTGWDRNLVTACCTQMLYVMAATVLLLFERDGLLWMSLLPGAAISTAYLAGNPLGLSREVAVSGVVLAMALAFASAIYAADRAYQEGPRSPIGLGRQDLSTSLEFGTYGLLVAACLAAPMMRAVMIAGTNPSMIAVATVPLMLSMGVAEWQLTRYVERRNRAMDAAHDIETFAHAAWRGLLISLGTHAAALLALSLVTVLGIFLTIGSIPGEALTLLAAYLLLGAALFLALVLTSWGRISMVLPFMALAVAAIWLTALSTHSTAEELTEYLLASAALAGCFFTLGWREVRVVTNHST
jgi:hypothetical protein